MTAATKGVEYTVAALGRMTVAQLRGKYLELFGEPTRSGNRDFLFKRIAWRVQSLAEGTLSERARRRAEELARDAVVARCVFLFGSQYALWEAGVIEQVELPDLDGLKAEVKERPDLNEQLRELREIAEEAVLQVAEAVQETVGIGFGEEALSQWEGFTRFCRRCLGVEPLTLLAAYGVRCEDPASEVLAVFPGAKADEAKAEERAGHWAGEWGRRFAT